MAGGSPRPACDWTDFADADGHRCMLKVPPASAVDPRNLFITLGVIVVTLPVLKLFDWVFFGSFAARLFP